MTKSLTSNKDLSYDARAKMRPHPIPYQGSKRKLADLILDQLPGHFRRFYEPFAGSAALTIAAASTKKADEFHFSDSCSPLIAIWHEILKRPDSIADGYEQLWHAQLQDPRGFYNVTREEFNETGRPELFLYLLARCVKGSVRFNREGGFNQSPDNRRRGMHPSLMRRHISETAHLLGTARVRCTDYEVAIQSATAQDFVYLDPPWMGVSEGPHRRYHERLDFDRFVLALKDLVNRRVPFALSFDGSCGTRQYGRPLPKELGLEQIALFAGRSTQATLLGRNEETVESLYLSPAVETRDSSLRGKSPRQGVLIPS